MRVEKEKYGYFLNYLHIDNLFYHLKSVVSALIRFIIIITLLIGHKKQNMTRK